MPEQEEPPPYFATDYWNVGDRRFVPLREESRGKVLLAALIGPVAWGITLFAIAWLLDHTHSLGFGLLVTLVSFGVSLVAMPLPYLGRRREERRYGAGPMA
jgi:hypothetical protein